MSTFWIPLSVVLGIVGFYFFLAFYLLCRFLGGWALGNFQSRRHAGKQPPLPAWAPPADVFGGPK